MKTMTLQKLLADYEAAEVPLRKQQQRIEKLKDQVRAALSRSPVALHARTQTVWEELRAALNHPEVPDALKEVLQNLQGAAAALLTDLEAVLAAFNPVEKALKGHVAELSTEHEANLQQKLEETLNQIVAALQPFCDDAEAGKIARETLAIRRIEQEAYGFRMQRDPVSRARMLISHYA